MKEDLPSGRFFLGWLRHLLTPPAHPFGGRGYVKPTRQTLNFYNVFRPFVPEIAVLRQNRVKKNAPLSYGFRRTCSLPSPYLVRIILICTFADVGARPIRKGRAERPIFNCIILKKDGKI